MLIVFIYLQIDKHSELFSLSISQLFEFNNDLSETRIQHFCFCHFFIQIFKDILINFIFFIFQIINNLIILHKKQKQFILSIHLIVYQ